LKNNTTVDEIEAVTLEEMKVRRFIQPIYTRGREAIMLPGLVKHGSGNIHAIAPIKVTA